MPEMVSQGRTKDEGLVAPNLDSNQQPHLQLPGCRHDILGHYLKAIGVLRVLTRCADHPKHADSEAEGWWDLENACFCLHSKKYPTMENLIQFFKERYRPTPVFAAWNNDVGGDTNIASKFNLSAERNIAVGYANQVVSVADKKKAGSVSKLTSSEAFASYRDDPVHHISEFLDAIAAPRFARASDNPIFLAKGVAGRAHLWRTFWEYLSDYEKQRKTKNFDQLICGALATGGVSKSGKGTPFFPDAIKGYNFGSGWVREKYPFNAFDYILAVEGALALRGSVARTIGASSKRFAAFPFIFDSGEDLVDDSNEVKGTASSLWLPLWDRKTTFEELASFISDAQARLPGKDARFSAEFVRALNAQGVDAGFAGWQEFRFKMKGSRVPWVSTGTCVTYAAGGQHENVAPTRLNQALSPLDESYFLDQFEIVWKGNKVDAQSPHPFRARINFAMETAALEPTPRHCLTLLEAIFAACRQMCVSKSFREKLRGGRPSFFKPLPMVEWEELLKPLGDPKSSVGPEFRIARAVASITGMWAQGDDSPVPVEPMLGSILPMKFRRSGWYLPGEDERHRQDVWSGSDICHDLAAVLQRRYMDSLRHDRPALMAVHGAPLGDVLAFLCGELDDGRISRWIEAMSLINWQFSQPDKELLGIAAEQKDSVESQEDLESIPLAYAAFRTLLDLECEHRNPALGQRKKRRSQQPFTLFCQRSVSALPLAISEALRWISIWGVRNPWGADARAERERIAGRYVVMLEHRQLALEDEYGRLLASRLAAAVCIPLAWKDRWQLARVITLPPGI